MIQKIDLTTLRKTYEQYDKDREKLIIQARAVLKASKQQINSLHAGNACKPLAAEEFRKLQKKVAQNSDLAHEGSYAEAAQEYAEAELFFDFVKKKPFRSAQELGVREIDYLSAVSDLTGELARSAVHATIKGNYEAVTRIHECVSDINSQLLNFSFRNSTLRKKYDAVKWNLRKIEDIMYDIHKLQTFLKK